MSSDMEPIRGKRGLDVVYDLLSESGIDLLIEIPGLQTLPLSLNDREGLTRIMARHETAIPHIAWGYYEAGGKPAATLTVPGPGDTNVMHGLKNALEDCVPIIHISAEMGPEDRGKGNIHEIEPDIFDNVVKSNINVEKSIDLSREISRGIEIALSPPYGPVRIGIPKAMLEEYHQIPEVEITPEAAVYDNDLMIDRAVGILSSSKRPLILVGGGARRSPGGSWVVKGLAEELDAPVICTYKGKGVYPEDGPYFLAVTHSNIPSGARRILEEADTVLALGTDLDGVATSRWRLPLGKRLVHVNIRPEDMNNGYSAEVSMVGDVVTIGSVLLEELESASDRAETWRGGEIASRVRSEYFEHLRAEGLLGGDSCATIPGALVEIRNVLPRDAIVVTDVGGFRLWAKHVFEVHNPRNYVTAGSWAGMGVGLPAALGAKLARPDDNVVALTGDGGLMMNMGELHTACEYGIDVTVIVFNDSGYGAVKDSSISMGFDRSEVESRFGWTTPKFAEIAEGFGCRAATVRSALGVGEALREAIENRDGIPWVIDFRVDGEGEYLSEANSYESDLNLDT